MIGDVLDWEYKKEEDYDGRTMDDLELVSFFETWISEVMLRWKKRREPIDNQSDKCVDYVYNLCK